MQIGFGTTSTVEVLSPQKSQREYSGEGKKKGGVQRFMTESLILGHALLPHSTGLLHALSCTLYSTGCRIIED